MPTVADILIILAVVSACMLSISFSIFIVHDIIREEREDKCSLEEQRRIK